MKKAILIFNLILFGSISFAQDSSSVSLISKGHWLIETNTGFGGIHPGNTGMHLKITNGTISWNIGGEVGYFITDKLALKGGLGFGNFTTGPSQIGNLGSESGGESGSESGGETGGEGTPTTPTNSLGSILSYKIGAKYYLIHRIPLQVDFSGTNVIDYNFELGFQGGYAFFLGTQKNISIEPGLRYGIPLLKNKPPQHDVFQFNIGLALLF